MADDWQETAFNNRHMHNRNARGSRSSKSNNAFDVRKTYGSYEIKCPAWQKLENVSTDNTASLELYRLTENGLGVVGEISLPGAFRAALLLAGSRESMRRTLEDLEDNDNNIETNEDQDQDESEEESSNEEPDRFSTFEKNSFRTPKFWLKYNATKPPPPPPKKNARQPAKEPEDDGSIEGTGMGYIVFTGNQCRKFKGTISCEELGWKDVSISGFKDVGRSESDTRVVWGKDVEM